MYCGCHNLMDKMKDYMEISIVSTCRFCNKSNINTRSSSDSYLRLQNLGISYLSEVFILCDYQTLIEDEEQTRKTHL